MMLTPRDTNLIQTAIRETGIGDGPSTTTIPLAQSGNLLRVTTTRTARRVSVTAQLFPAASAGKNTGAHLVTTITCTGVASATQKVVRAINQESRRVA